MKSEMTSSVEKAAASAAPGGHEEDASRRRFLRSAVAGVSLAGALPVVSLGAGERGSAVPAASESGQRRQAELGGSEALDPLAQILQRYGSELGGLTRVD